MIDALARAIIADPPWFFRDRGSRMAPTYDLMPTAEIAALDVASFALPDALLFMWCPSSMLADGLYVMRAWSFALKGTMVWCKVTYRGDPIIGGGHYMRNAHELILVGGRGKAAALIKNKGVPSWFTDFRGKHSQKPDTLHDLVERLVDGPYLELFARRERRGWRCLGNELGTVLKPKHVELARAPPAAMQRNAMQRDATGRVMMDANATLDTKAGTTKTNGASAPTKKNGHAKASPATSKKRAKKKASNGQANGDTNTNGKLKPLKFDLEKVRYLKPSAQAEKFFPLFAERYSGAGAAAKALLPIFLEFNGDESVGFGLWESFGDLLKWTAAVDEAIAGIEKAIKLVKRFDR